MPRMKNLEIENAQLMGGQFKNFSGEKRKFNADGRRNFHIKLESGIADQLINDGWNVKVLAPREEGDEPVYHLKVEVSYKNFPPKIYLIAGRKKTLLNEDTVGTLDTAEITNADIIISPYHWVIDNQAGHSEGIKAYVDTMYVTIKEDCFAGKYDFGDEEETELPW